ncbi:probable protein phosphatase 2C 54 [Magnolia sinica]|uniref:probable protein phosphatase 2C 54 n=1 Tax=Magnolia sinica TaxID=86752 RepID=UPI00265A4F18|nr:probable protein phosphatase 2C 54 [Magnolia sinica]
MCKGAVYSRHPFDLVLFKQLYWWASCIALDIKQNQPSNFSPIIRPGEWSNIGSRTSMDDTHVCIANLAKKFRYNFLDDEAISFYRWSSTIVEVTLQLQVLISGFTK